MHCRLSHTLRIDTEFRFQRPSTLLHPQPSRLVLQWMGWNSMGSAPATSALYAYPRMQRLITAHYAYPRMQRLITAHYAYPRMQRLITAVVSESLGGTDSRTCAVSAEHSSFQKITSDWQFIGQGGAGFGFQRIGTLAR